MAKSWKKENKYKGYLKDYEWKTTTKNIRNFASEKRQQADILSEEEEEENEF